MPSNLFASQTVKLTVVYKNKVKLFFNGLGGTHPVLFWVLFIGGLVICEAVLTVQTWFVGHWAEQYVLYPPEQVNITL